MGSSKPYVSIVFFNPFMHRSSHLSNIDLSTLAGNLVDTRCDLSVVSDLKTVRMPCCCRHRRRASDNPLTYGSTVVDLISGAGSFVAVCFHNVFHKP